MLTWSDRVQDDNADVSDDFSLCSCVSRIVGIAYRDSGFLNIGPVDPEEGGITVRLERVKG